MIFIKIFAVIIIFSAIPAHSQVGFLLDGPSTESGAEFGAYSALPSSDPMGFYYNPAQLGFFGKKNTQAFCYPNYNDFGNLGDASEQYSTSLNISSGWNFKNIYKDCNASLGIGYSRFLINLGSIENDAGSEDIYELYNHIAVGVTVDYVIKIGFGLGFKSISANNMGSGTNSTISSDYGIMVSIPVTKLINIKSAHELDVGFGLAQMHNGEGLRSGNFRLESSTGKVPLPNENIAGYSVVYTYSSQKEPNRFSWLKLSYSSEAHNPIFDGPLSNRSNSIDFIRNVIKSEYENDIRINRTLKLDIYNHMLSYSFHRLIADERYGADNFTAHTYVLSLPKALTWFSNESANPIEDFDLRLSMTSSNKYGNSKMYGVTVELSSIEIITSLFD